MMRPLRLLIPTALWCLLASAALGQSYSGQVYLDANKNGRRDANERGIADVPITDGVQFVKTDAAGRYEISVRPDPVLARGGAQAIALTCPSGKAPTTPWYRLIPDLESNENVDFGLADDEQKLPFTFIHMTDAHSSRLGRWGKSQMTAFRRDMDSVGSKIAFCFLGGDNVTYCESQWFRAVSRDYSTFGQLIRNFPTRLYAVTGNHDVCGISQHIKDEVWRNKYPDFYAYGFHTRVVGPVRSSFNYAGVHFVGVEWAEYVPAKKAWRFTVPATTVKWLEKDFALLAPGTRICLVMHYPSAPGSFWKLLRKYKVEQVFAGHTHRSRSFRVAGIKCDTTRALGAAGNCYRVVHVTRDGMFSRVRGAGSLNRVELTLHRPRKNSWVKKTLRVRGSILDTKGTVKKAMLKIGSHEQELTLTRSPMAAFIEADVDVSKIEAGVWSVTVTADGGGKRPMRATVRCLILSGRHGAFKAEHEATLKLNVGGIDHGAKVFINDELLADLKPTKLKGDANFKAPVRGTEVVSIPIPAAKLRRLNWIRLEPLKDPDGKVDRFCVVDCHIQYGKKTYRDITISISQRRPAYVKDPYNHNIDIAPGK